MNLFNADSEHYNFLNTIVEESELRGGHAVYENELDFIDPNQVDLENLETVIPEEVKKEADKRQNKLKRMKNPN